MPKFCAQCGGARANETAKFCGECGTPFPDAGAEAAEAPAVHIAVDSVVAEEPAAVFATVVAMEDGPSVITAQPVLHKDPLVAIGPSGGGGGGGGGGSCNDNGPTLNSTYCLCQDNTTQLQGPGLPLPRIMRLGMCQSKVMIDARRLGFPGAAGDVQQAEVKLEGCGPCCCACQSQLKVIVDANTQVKRARSATEKRVVLSWRG